MDSSFAPEGRECSKELWEPTSFFASADHYILGLMITVWFVAGIRFLIRELRENVSSRDAEQLHDAICQGVTVADSMRSSQQSNWIRRIKIGAIWLEWPSFTLTVLRVFFAKVGLGVHLIDLSFNGWAETLLLLFLSTFILVCIVSHVIKTTETLERYVYPIIFNLTFIALTMVCTRVALCMNGAQNLTLPDGTTCECLVRYPYFAVLGTFGFIGMYIGGLRYRADEQHQMYAKDLRFQTSFQITMVLARASNPLFSAVLTMLSDSNSSTPLILVMSLFVTIHGLLLIYSYTFQPCIGSGLFVNNIRVLVFSSSTYVGLATLLALLSDIGQGNDALLLLLPLPIIWISAWCINSKRAVKFHVPRASISDLLILNPYRVRVVGAIAALHLNATQVTSEEASRIILHLSQRLEDKKEESMVRVHVARTLWHFLFQEFAAAGKVLRDKVHTPDGRLLTGDIWQRDIEDGHEDRQIDCFSRVPLRHRHEACGRVRRSSAVGLIKSVSHPETVSVPCKRSQILPATETLRRKSSVRISLSDATASIKKMAKRIVSLRSTSVGFDGLRDPLQGDEVVIANQKLVDTVTEILYLSTYTAEANVQAAKLLLDLFRADHIELTPETYVRMIAYLCSYTKNPEISRQSVYNLHRSVTTIDDTVARTFWSRNYLMVKYISSALASRSPKTIQECTEALTRIMTTLCLLRKGKVQIFLPSQFLRHVFLAFQLRLENYPMAHALENLVLVLDKIGKETSIIPRGRKGPIDMTCSATTQAPSLVAAVRSLVLGNEVIQTDTTRRIALVRSNSIVVAGSNFVPSRVVNEVRTRRNLADKQLQASRSLSSGQPMDAARRERWIALVRESLHHRKYGSYLKTFLMEALSDEQVAWLKQILT